MFINFGFNNIFTEQYILEIKIGNNIEKHSFEGSPEIIQMQFLEMLQQSTRSNQPVRIRISKQEEIWDNFNKQNKNIENYIQFANKKYMDAFPNEFRED